jgi:hypothetical protein
MAGSGLAILDRMAAQTPWLRRALIATACVVAGCAPSAAPPTSVPPTEIPAEVGNLPSGCDPIDLRSPDGQAVDLNGTWIQGGEGGRTAATWWIRTVGDCIWGTGIFDDYTEGRGVDQPDSVQGLQGRMGDDFVIDSTIVFLGPHPGRAILQYRAEVRIILDFDDDGQIILREDREPGVAGPRCPDPVNYCPPPLVLRRSGL